MIQGPDAMSTDFAKMRDAMVESQLRTVAVDDSRVVRAMATVPREDFVPEGKQKLAYAEMMLPLGGGRSMNLPLATGRLLTALRLTPEDRVLVVGAGTGYAAALCARLAGAVVALESDEELAAAARSALASNDNVEIVTGDMAAGWPDGGPYDAVLFDGAVEQIPQAITDQLADGGRLAAAVVEDGVSRLKAGRKVGGAFGTTAFLDAEACVLPGFERPRAFVFQ